jgi:preprotein translocase subunit SecA
MEFNISELDELNDNMYDQIPENKPIKIIKKDTTNKVRFSQTAIPTPTTTTTTKSAIKKVTRPHVPEQKPKLSYDDILSKMGMFVAEGQLHLLDNQPLEVQQQIKQQIKKPVKQQPVVEQYVEQYVEQPNQNSYIYNKYFSNEIQNTDLGPRVPKSLQEYRNMLLQDLVQKQRVRKLKSTILIMPTSNINFSPYSTQNMNRLFSFSNR